MPNPTENAPPMASGAGRAPAAELDVMAVAEWFGGIIGAARGAPPARLAPDAAAGPGKAGRGD